MSWKASAYVKELCRNITPSEKLLLFVLADYHNTAQQVAWPSMATLAEEALMSERQCSRLLQQLENKGFIQRLVPKGGHRSSLYFFVALDQGRLFAGPGKARADTSVIPESAEEIAGMTLDVTPGDSRDDIGMTSSVYPGNSRDDIRVDKFDTAIRKEPVLEPVKPNTNRKHLPDWLPPEPWKAFLEHRKKIRKPLTEYGENLVIKKLHALRENGHDPTAVLDQSISQGWQGVFELHEDTKGAGRNGKPDHFQRVSQARNQAVANIRAAYEA